MKFFTAVLLFFSLSINSQETLKVMYYNILNFPSSSPERADTLKNIIDHTLPDVLVVNELESQFGANLIMANALNTNGNTFSQAVFVNGPDTDNLLFYNNQKLGLISQQQIATALRDVSEYVLYYKDPNLSVHQDTIYMFFYSCHLKASSGVDNEQQRYAEAQILKAHIYNRQGKENVIVGGDFNLYSPLEPAFYEMLNGANYHLNDPINNSSEWHANYACRSIHTQSTRTSPGLGGGSTGGMDDRFDFIFVNDQLISGVKGVRFKQGSYTAVGQDGQHYNSSIAAPPNNSEVPQQVAISLQNMSDHLPVMMEINVGLSVGFASSGQIKNRHFWDNGDLNIIMEADFKGRIEVVDLSGRLVFADNIGHQSQLNVNFGRSTAGIYLVKLTDVNGSIAALKVYYSGE